jgi:hypothetical protein
MQICGGEFTIKGNDTMNKYLLISDPGHGWLRVPTLEVIRLGIADKISSYSYIDWDGRSVYLEEDSDLAIFARAKGWPPGTLHNHIDEAFQDPCKIRDMPTFYGKHYAAHIEVVSA